MSTEVPNCYLELHNDEDPKQKELAVRILDAYEKSRVLELDMQWPLPPLREQIVSAVEANLRFQIESVYELVEAYKNVNPITLPFLNPPYKKRNVRKFIEQCEKSREEGILLEPELARKHRWAAYFMQQTQEGLISMELIPRGYFEMGHREGETDSKRVHKIQITHDFWISRTLLTQQKYKEICKEIAEREGTCTFSEEPSKYWGPLRPIESLNWFEALEFCNALSKLEGFEPVYNLEVISSISSQKDLSKIKCDLTAKGYRLPTEAEWEYAARANRKYRFSGSNNIEDIAWYQENSLVFDRHCTIPVASKRPNSWGIFDMTGNVDEWCWDGYERNYYQKSPQKNPLGARTSPTRVIRGGAYDAYPTPVWERNKALATQRRDDIGIRLVRTA